MSGRATGVLVAALALPACAPPGAATSEAPDLSVDGAAVIDGGGDAAAPDDPLEVRFLGVGGFLLRSGDQAVMTAPLYTRPSMLEVTAGSIASDGALVRRSLPASALEQVRAVVSGHAHYDHLLDTPEVLRAAPHATLYANLSARNLLAALAPDRASRCDGTPASTAPIARSRVVALDDPAASQVDWRPCENLRPAGAPLSGAWVRVPDSRVRLYAICSEHPDQIGPIHFGPGDVTEEQCQLPRSAGDWREGRTLGFLIDFLDENDRPRYRVFYQDAPTTIPIGLPPADVLAEKRIDLALLCVGNYDRVEGAPATTLQALSPRFALGGHWEDFFRSASDPPQPLPFHDLGAWTTQAQAALFVAEAIPWQQAGQPLAQRALLPQPNDELLIFRSR